MSKQMRQPITPTHILGATGTDEADDLGYRSLSSLKSDLNLDNVDNTSDATKNSAVATLVNKTITNSTGVFTALSSTADSALNGVTVGRGGGNISFNTAIGCLALSVNTTGCYNAAFGAQTLRCNTTGDENTAVGTFALGNNSSGNNNTATGYAALNSNTSGLGNTATGSAALGSNTAGGSNTATGRDALVCNTSGCQNTATGTEALKFNLTTSGNTATGYRALNTNSTGANNTATGVNALFANTCGENNIGIGVNAGRTGGTPEGIVNITTECNRIVMGNDDHTCAQIKIAWTATSDCRDKLCFKPIKHGLTFVRALKPTEYQFKTGGRDSTTTDGKRRYGFLAQDILPLEGKNPVIISKDNPDKLQYTEAHMIPVLVKAIQELAAEVEALKNA